MSEDLIRRSDAVNELAKFLGVPARAFIHEAEKLLKDVPSAQRWIPVTERLPESGQSVLIAENDTDPDWYAAIGQYKYGRWEWRDDMHTALPPKVIAWMPLPKPWEGGEA